MPIIIPISSHFDRATHRLLTAMERKEKAPIHEIDELTLQANCEEVTRKFTAGENGWL